MKNLIEMLNIQHPIISAPMGVVAGAKLACAVTKSGGLGLIGGGYCDQGWIQNQLNLAEPGQFGIGFITWRLQQFPDALPLALRYSPRAIMLSFGDISPFVNSVKSAGIPLICQVQTAAQAVEVKAQGADVIVAQGTEAGGHGADQPLLSLLPEVLDIAGDTPVVAAGGLVDGQSVANVISLGAQGALMGTRFYATEESLGADAQKQRIVEASSDETVRTRVFDYARGFNWPQPYTGRALGNAFYEKWRHHPDMLSEFGADQQKAYDQSAKKNDFDVAGVFVGEGVGRIKEIRSVADTMAAICSEL